MGNGQKPFSIRQCILIAPCGLCYILAEDGDGSAWMKRIAQPQKNERMTPPERMALSGKNGKPLV